MNDPLLQEHSSVALNTIAQKLWSRMIQEELMARRVYPNTCFIIERSAKAEDDATRCHRRRSEPRV
jgi:hypothetical protein